MLAGEEEVEGGWGDDDFCWEEGGLVVVWKM